MLILSLYVVRSHRRWQSQAVSLPHLLYSLWLPIIIWESTLVWLIHPETPGIPTFCTDISKYSLANQKWVMCLECIDSRIFPSAFRSDMVLKSLIPVDSSSFGMKQPSDVRSVWYPMALPEAHNDFPEHRC